MSEQHPRLPGEVVLGEHVADAVAAWPVVARDEAYTSPYVSLSVETIEAPDGSHHGRAVVRPNGAVGIAALDEDDRILLVEQYRHPVGRRLLELPAGTLDVAGEAAVDAARRELAEEADLAADHWESLIAPIATPGYSTETWEIFVATGLNPTEHDYVREGEEADMRRLWVQFEDAVTAVLDGRISDSMTVCGILAIEARRRRR